MDVAEAQQQAEDLANPFSEPVWDTPHALPPFERIRPEHYLPAFDRALTAHEDEIDAIAGNPEAPSFANTLVALELSGAALRRVSSTFFNLTGAHTNPELQAIERAMAPRLARHRSALFLNDALHARVRALPDADLSPEEARVLERYRTIFRRAGADRPREQKERLAAISARLAELGTAFSQNLLADESDYELVLEGEADRAGLPDFLVSAAAKAAQERGRPGGHVITLSRSLIEPFLVTSTRRDLRAKAYEAWIRRGERGGETDNRAIIAETLALRAERARILGYESFAHFKLADTMAGTPEAAMGLLTEVWTPARARATADRDRLQALMRAEGAGDSLGPADWRHYAEKLRRAEHALDEGEVKAHLPLDGMIEAAFDTAGRLFGLSFAELEDFPRYHPDVRAFEVSDRDGRSIGLFLGDYFARASKRSGAWMSAFRSQERLSGEVTPIIVNVMNFAKGGEGEPALLSFDDARTLFHEFGHALHGLLSNVTHPLLAGTAVAGDFVELPSQLYEHWLEEPDVLARFARHHRTGAPMPDDLIRRVIAARTFGQGFSTVEYTASAIVDLELHLAGDGVGDPLEATQATLSRLGMPPEIAMRHRTPHFAHVFAGEGYAAGYYSYLWSEVLDADAYDAFREAGDPFDPGTAQRLRDAVYAAGNLRDPRAAYTAFRGRLPDTAPLLRQRGLDRTAA